MSIESDGWKIFRQMGRERGITRSYFLNLRGWRDSRKCKMTREATGFLVGNRTSSFNHSITQSDPPILSPTYVCTYVCMYVSMYVRTYVYCIYVYFCM